jgi:hypothetical protein
MQVNCLLLCRCCCHLNLVQYVAETHAIQTGTLARGVLDQPEIRAHALLSLQSEQVCWEHEFSERNNSTKVAVPLAFYKGQFLTQRSQLIRLRSVF